jgi:hypothetical protein
MAIQNLLGGDTALTSTIHPSFAVCEAHNQGGHVTRLLLVDTLASVGRRKKVTPHRPTRKPQKDASLLS